MLDDLDVDGRVVLVRADLNVPLDDGEITDDFRIRAALPTIELLRERGATVVVCSHLGRPKGHDPALSTAPIAVRLAGLGGFPVVHVPAVVGPVALAAVEAAQPGDVLLLENTRFESGETTNGFELADGLAELADMFVLDAFGSAHRAHASTVGVAERIPSAAGPLLAAEVAALGEILHDPPRPYVVVMGGAKVSSKLGVIRQLLPGADLMLIGGGMCFTLLEAGGFEVGGSLIEESMVAEVKELLESEHGGKIILPLDVVVADRFAEDAETQITPAIGIPEDWLGLDIGPETSEHFASVIAGAGAVFWNGPMGVFEMAPFRSGTEAVAQAMAATSATTIVGGGDSVAAVRSLGLEEQMDHVSTGGGAGLEMLEGTILPGVAALGRWIEN
ncbi:MAG: phosphoglycerate kinase [Acidimicrobiia bacterium]|nr:phosphoglycerate kinase [Acidimicrobiia bacterium]